MKTKIKSYGAEDRDFYYKEILEVDSNHTFLAVISLDSALKTDENCYLPVILNESKYTEKKLISHINNSSDFSSFD